MKVRDVEEKIYPTYIGLSPHLVFTRHHEVIRKYGVENFLTKREFKRAREVYQTAVYALGMTARTGNFYWITPGKDDTPDCYLIWLNGRKIFVECVEITLWNAHVDHMWEIIKKKIDKQYPSDFSIVIHDSHGEGAVHSSYYQQLHEKLKECSVPAGAVRFWTQIKNKSVRDVLIGELYPENTWMEFSAHDILCRYPSKQQILRIDVISRPRRVRFDENDFQNIVLPELPDIQWV